MDQAKQLGVIEFANSNSDDAIVAYFDGFRMENESVIPSTAQKEPVPSLLDIVVERPPGNLSKKKGKRRTNKKKLKVKLQKVTDADKAHKYKIFVKKLTKEVTPQKLKEYFGRYGTIADVTIINQNTISAFVKFSKVDSLIELFKNTHVINGTTVEIHPNIHLKNEYRQSMKEKI